MVKFISYDGKYPNLCSGVLTVDIDGEIHKFHYSFYKREDTHLHTSFWTTGGECSWNPEYTQEAPWKLSVFDEDFSEEMYEELLEVFNENVPFGCCGGCI